MDDIERYDGCNRGALLWWLAELEALLRLCQMSMRQRKMLDEMADEIDSALGGAR